MKEENKITQIKEEPKVTHMYHNEIQQMMFVFGEVQVSFMFVFGAEFDVCIRRGSICIRRGSIIPF